MTDRPNPFAEVSPDQLRALARAGRKWIGPDLSEKIWADLHEEHARMADQWAAELGNRASSLFVGGDFLAGRPELTSHARIVDLSEAPAGLLDPFSIQEADPLTADERRALAVDTLRALTIPATDDTVANVKDQP